MRYYYEIANRKTNQTLDLLGNSFEEVLKRNNLVASEWVILYREDLDN